MRCLEFGSFAHSLPTARMEWTRRASSMVKLLVQWLLSAFALLVVSNLVNGFEVNGLGAALAASLVIGLLNAPCIFTLGPSRTACVEQLPAGPLAWLSDAAQLVRDRFPPGTAPPASELLFSGIASLQGAVLFTWRCSLARRPWWRCCPSSPSTSPPRPRSGRSPRPRPKRSWKPWPPGACCWTWRRRGSRSSCCLRPWRASSSSP
jgi:hypothetical protein